MFPLKSCDLDPVSSPDPGDDLVLSDVGDGREQAEVAIGALLVVAQTETVGAVPEQVTPPAVHLAVAMQTSEDRENQVHC